MASDRRLFALVEVSAVGDFERSFDPMSLETGRAAPTGGRGGADLLRLMVFLPSCVGWGRLLGSLEGLRSKSSSMTRPISKSSSESGLVTLTLSSTTGRRFFASRILKSCFPPWPESNRPVGRTRPSSSPSSSSSSSSVSNSPAEGAEVEFDEGEALGPNPRVE